MSPDSVESQIGRLRDQIADLGKAQARTDQRMDDLSGDVHNLTPLVVTTTELRGGLVGVNRELGTVKEDVKSILDALDTRDKQTTAERAANRRALMALTGVILAAVIAGIFAVVVQLLVSA